jgi:hypothetical protein
MLFSLVEPAVIRRHHHLRGKRPRDEGPKVPWAGALVTR